MNNKTLNKKLFGKKVKDYREKRSYYENNREEVKKILQEATIAAKKQAEETMKKVRASMKLDYLDK